MSIKEYNLLIDKAKTRKDGVYSYSPYLYVVKDNKFIAYADYSGNIFSCHGAFTTTRGKCERYDRRKTLLNYLKQQ